ncbi:Na+/H+ antiporter subunit A [Abyssicoccus albus]|uniref:Multisubunit sodium/proton antiporter MrpA subunit n=1 Tax=Abyssicoccus albus TaxID=1817405 RepID=A0A3N5BIC7_9BACL|nr:Na+/H+ antiporter subunit A [Abyssicoccus albus]RPF57576.1 multisubunit sodium/proton antiporter MrpA subunit [Abyssicoccus albus]
MTFLHIAIFIPIIWAIIVKSLERFIHRLHIGWYVLPVPVFLFIYFLTYIPIIKGGDVHYSAMHLMHHFMMDFNLYIDGLSLLFALLITGIGSLVVLYSIGYLSQKEQLSHFYIYLLMFMTAMLGVVLSDNLLMLYLFWELTSISSFLLISFWNNRARSLYGAHKSMIITVFGGVMMLGGFIIIGNIAGTFNIHEIIPQFELIQSTPSIWIAIILILLGAFTKSAQFPFYIWLPDAMEAPTPVSAYLHSATMVKAGIYLVARLTPIFSFHDLWIYSVSFVGLITLVWASFNAVKQDDLKGVLAFSTVSQLGMIMSILGLAAFGYNHGYNDAVFQVATVGAIFHLINHATFKGSLFMIVGIVDHETHTRSLKKLGGLMTLMPITTGIATVTALSMAGVPPFNGFLSKEMFIKVMYMAMDAPNNGFNNFGIIFPILAIIGSIFTFIYSIMFVIKTFGGKLNKDDIPQVPHEAPWLMLASPLILAVLVVFFGLFPNVLSETIIEPARNAMLHQSIEEHVHISMFHGVNKALISTIVIFIIGSILFYFLKSWIHLYDKHPEKLTLNYYYDRLLDFSSLIARKITQSYMTGFTRTYLVYLFSFLSGLTLFALVMKDIQYSLPKLGQITIVEITITLIIVISTTMIIIAKSRLFSIIMLSCVGYSMALFFVFFRAPDLALTQLAIETITTALFLICFYHLPKLSRHEEQRRFKIGNFIVAISVGLSVIAIGLLSLGNKTFDSISQYYIDNVYKLGAGENMVNVILVDFRGFDTLFETVVLAITGIGIYILVKLRLSKGGRRNEKTR